MQLYGPDEKPIPPNPETGWKRIRPSLLKVWHRLPTLVKLPVAIGLVAGICTIFVHGHTIWRWVYSTEPAVQPVKVVNPNIVEMDYVRGTRITYRQVEENFPFGYIVIRLGDGKWIRSEEHTSELQSLRH